MCFKFCFISLPSFAKHQLKVKWANSRFCWEHEHKTANFSFSFLNFSATPTNLVTQGTFAISVEVKLACKQALGMGYSEIFFRIARGGRERGEPAMVLVSSLSRPPPSYSKANLRIPVQRACLQAKVKWVKVMPISGTQDTEDEPPDLPSSKQLLPHLLNILKFLSSKWLAIVNLHCTGEA